MFELEVYVNDSESVVEAIKLLNHTIGRQSQYTLNVGWDALKNDADMLISFDMLSGEYLLTIDESSDKIGHNFDAIEDSEDEFHYHKRLRNALAAWI